MSSLLLSSINACAIDMETINTQRNSGETWVNNAPDDANNIAPAVLTWIPGIIPVVVPINMPIKHAITNSIIAIH